MDIIVVYFYVVSVWFVYLLILHPIVAPIYVWKKLMVYKHVYAHVYDESLRAT